MTPGTIGIALALGAAAIMAILIFVKTHVVVCAPNEAVILSGRKKGFRVIRGGRGFRRPLIETVSRISLNTIPIDVKVSKALSAGMISLDVEGIATVKVAGQPEGGLENAVERFLGKSHHEIQTVARQTLEGSLRGVLATRTPEDANAERLAIAEAASESARADFRRLGLLLDTFKIQHLSDTEGYLDAIGRKRSALVRRDARVAEARAEAEARGERQRELRARDAYGPEDRGAFERCIMGFNSGPPMNPSAYNNNMQLFQTPDHVAIVTEMVNTARIVPLDGRPTLPADMLQWSGESRGHWEGDTLVIETTNFDPRRLWRSTTGSMHLTERLTRIDADTLFYQATVNDPETWERPWTFEVPMKALDGEKWEYACHEGHRSMPLMLGGARALEAREAAGGQQ